MAGLKNTEKFKVHQEYFSGGVSIDPKLATANSFYYSQNLDFRSKPSQISVLPASRQLATNLADVITDMDQDLNGVRWGVGNNGGIYKISTSNVVSKEAQLPENGAAGILYNQVTDQLYIPSQTAVSMFGQVTSGNSNQPAYRQSQFAQSASTDSGCVNLFSTPANVATYGGSGAGFFDGYARNNVQSLSTGITEAIVQSGVVISNTQAGNNPVTPGTAQTYILPSTLTEATGNFCFFAPDIEPFYSIMVYIASAGSGNWTLTLHDSLNTKLASVTINNANIVAGQYNEFVFSSQIRALVSASQTGTNATYHFHLTSSVSSDSAAVGTILPSDMNTCDFLLFAYRLVYTYNGWHPTALFTGTGTPLLCVGNGQYLSTYNFGNDSNPSNGQWSRHYLQFKHGYEVCGLTTNNTYLVIAVERRSNNASRNAQDGCLYFWDGSTNAPNIAIDIPMGSPYGLYTFNNVTYFTVAGSLFAWSGGQTIIKVRKIAAQNTDYLNAVDSTIVSPNTMAARYNLLMIGYPSTSTNTTIPYGVYSWGTVELTFPNSFGLSYTQSHGYLYNNTSGVSNLTIGCVQNFVDSMYISWSYTLSGQTYYGLDIVDNFSTAAASYNWQSLIYDGGVRYKTKKALRLKISFLPLPANTTLTAQYSLERGAWVTSDPNGAGSYSANTGDTSVVVEFNNARFKEIQYGFLGTCSSPTTAPTITGVTLEVDPLEDEDSLRKDSS